jgi:glycosyltransferase involved in cell wall biosynthesis
MPGWLSDVTPWFTWCDMLVHCASMEAFGRVIAEAAAHGRMAIVPDTPAMRELVMPAETGLTFRPGDVDDLLATMLTASELPDPTVHDVEAAARRHAVANFSIEKMADAYERLCIKALHSERRD